MADFDARMAALRRKFVERLHGEAGYFASCVDGNQPADPVEIAERAHRLAGIAGSMGQPAITEAAKALEILLQSRSSSANDAETKQCCTALAWSCRNAIETFNTQS